WRGTTWGRKSGSSSSTSSRSVPRPAPASCRATSCWRSTGRNSRSRATSPGGCPRRRTTWRSACASSAAAGRS
ncbi:MAG: hypothetical protein AVDCRST_MAG88-142, partial [uncultured Thermomicrobiales bacterium]